MTPDLDVVVLGGAGHVGLPLSLAFADAGLRTGIYDISQPALDRIAAGEMPFLEAGAEELLAKVLRTGRRPDLAAPPPRLTRRAPEHGLPRDDGLRRPALEGARLRGGRRVLSGA